MGLLEIPFITVLLHTYGPTPSTGFRGLRAELSVYILSQLSVFYWKRRCTLTTPPGWVKGSGGHTGKLEISDLS